MWTGLPLCCRCFWTTTAEEVGQVQLPLYLWSFPLDVGLHLQLAEGEVIVHEQSVPAHRVDVRALRRHVSAQEVRQPAPGLRAEQLVGADRVHIIVQRREGSLRGQTQRLSHVKAETSRTPPSVRSQLNSPRLWLTSTWAGKLMSTGRPRPPGQVRRQMLTWAEGVGGWRCSEVTAAGFSLTSFCANARMPKNRKSPKINNVKFPEKNSNKQLHSEVTQTSSVTDPDLKDRGLLWKVGERLSSPHRSE